MDGKRAYSEAYLSEAMSVQGKFFERLQDLEGPIDSADLIDAYMHGSTRRQIDEGHAYYLTLDADRLREVFLQESGYQMKKGEPLRGFMPNWIGRFYAYGQWYWNIPSAELCDKLPVSVLRSAYPGAHDQDIRDAVLKLGNGLFDKTQNEGDAR